MVRLFLYAAMAAILTVPASLVNATESQSIAISQQGGIWSGTASAVCECSDGKCKVVTCEVDSAISYESAEEQLKIALNKKFDSEGGKQKGSISFSIKKIFK